MTKIFSRIPSLFFLSGCLYTEKTYRPPPVKADCASVICTVYANVIRDDLVDCYGWDTGEETWVEPPPAELEGCTPGDAPCAVLAVTDSFDPISTECDGCFDSEDATETQLDDCCLEPEDFDVLTSLPESFEEDYGAFLSNVVHRDCGVPLITSFATVQCEDLDPLSEDSWLECDDTDQASRSYGGQYDLIIDPDVSYFDFDPPGAGFVHSTLSGFGASATGPKRFVAGFMWAEPTLTAGGQSWVNTRIELHGDILMSGSSGNFTVPVSQNYTLAVYSTVNGQNKGYGLEPGADATGVFDAENGFWELDYSSQNSSGAVDIHLEGSLLPISSP